MKSSIRIVLFIFALVALALLISTTGSSVSAAPEATVVKAKVVVGYDTINNAYGYTPVVRNTGRHAAKNVEVRVRIPPQAEYMYTTNYNCQHEGSFVVCRTNRIAPGERVTYSLTFKMNGTWDFRQRTVVSGDNFETIVRRPRIYPY